PRMARVMAEVFAERGHSVLVARGEDGLDEFTTTAPTRVWVVSGGKVEERLVDAVDLGIPRSVPGDLRGGDRTVNAAVARRVLAGEPGPVRDAVVLNAAAALAAHEGLNGDLEENLRRGIARASEAIDSGAAARTLETWVRVANG